MSVLSTRAAGRFRRPASAQEILHPPRSRIGQYAYLTGVAVFALALGVARQR